MPLSGFILSFNFHLIEYYAVLKSMRIKLIGDNVQHLNLKPEGIRLLHKTKMCSVISGEKGI